MNWFKLRNNLQLDSMSWENKERNLTGKEIAKSVRVFCDRREKERKIGEKNYSLFTKDE